MQTCSTCGHVFAGERCPACKKTVSGLAEVWKYVFWPSTVALIGFIVIDGNYPRLTYGSVTTDLMLALFVMPSALVFGMVRFERLVRHVALVKQPPIEVPARVVAKQTGRLRFSGFHILILRMLWDQKTTDVGCFVDSQTFSQVEPSDSVLLLVHPGAFAQAWYGDVLVDEQRLGHSAR